MAADDGALEALFEALKACAMEHLDISGVELGPAGLTLLSAMLAPGTLFSAAMKSLNLSANKLFGQRSRDNDDRPPYVHDVDKDQTGWRAICQAFKGTSIETLVIVDVGGGSRSQQARPPPPLAPTTWSLTLASLLLLPLMLLLLLMLRCLVA